MRCFRLPFVVVVTAGINPDGSLAVNATDQKRVSILIAITENNEVWINRKAVEVEAVRAIVEKLHLENVKGTVSIQADKKAKAGLTMQVMAAVRLAGVPNVSISTLKDR